MQSSSNLRLFLNSSSPAGFRMRRCQAMSRRFSRLGRSERRKKRGHSPHRQRCDRDTFQLASECTTILYPIRAGKMARIGPEDVRARYGVDPKQVPDFIALRGDPSDKMPGAPGVGAAGGATLLQRYGSLEPRAEGREISCHGGNLAALPVDRCDGQEGAAAQSSKPKAELG